MFNIKEKKYPTGTPMTESQVRELIDVALREALSSQARELESHLKSLHDRVQTLEKTQR